MNDTKLRLRLIDCNNVEQQYAQWLKENHVLNHGYSKSYCPTLCRRSSVDETPHQYPVQHHSDGSQHQTPREKPQREAGSFSRSRKIGD